MSGPAPALAAAVRYSPPHTETNDESRWRAVAAAAKFNWRYKFMAASAVDGAKMATTSLLKAPRNATQKRTPMAPLPAFVQLGGTGAGQVTTNPLERAPEPESGDAAASAAAATATSGSISELRTAQIGGMVKSCWFSPDCNFFGVTGDETIRVYDVSTGAVVAEKKHRDSIGKSAVSPVQGADGKLGICVGCVGTGGLFYYTFAAGDPDASLAGPAWETAKKAVPAVLDVVFSGDGSTVFASSKDGKVRVFDTAGGQLVSTLQNTGVHSKIVALAYTSDGTGDALLACGGEDGIHVWRKSDGFAPESGSLFAGFKAAVSALDFSEPGAYMDRMEGSRHLMLACGTTDGCVRLYRKLDRRPLFLSRGEQKATVTAIRFSFERNEPLVVAGWQSGQFLVYDVATAAVVARFDHPGTNNGHALAFSPDSVIVAAGGGSEVPPTLHYVRQSDGGVEAVYPGGGDAGSSNIMAAEIGSTSHYAVVGIDEDIYVYDYDTKEKLYEIRTAESLDKMQVLLATLVLPHRTTQPLSGLASRRVPWFALLPSTPDRCILTALHSHCPAG
eukprot:SAG22_NODE_1083_length_5646_cov_8.060934_1_plen_560_part_00